MRLRESQQLINTNITKVNLTGSQVSTNPVQYKIVNLISTKKALDDLSILKGLQKDIGNLRLTSIYATAQDSINVSANEYTQIQDTISKIKIAADLLLQTFDDALHGNILGAEAVSIKIPVINDFDELLELANKFKKSLSLPVSEFAEGGQIKISNFDSGTFWIDILLPTVASVNLVGAIVWAGAVIYKKYQEAFAFKAYAKGLEIQTEHLKNLQEAAEKFLNMQIEAEAKLLQNEYYKQDNAEQLGRLKMSVKEISELIQKGVEIQPSIAVPENVSNLFPNFKTLELVASKVKQIAN